MQSRWRRHRRLVLSALAGLAALLLLATATKAVSLRAYLVPTASMAPTIAPGERIGVQTEPDGPPRRGEIWAFRMPAASATPGTVAVKRVVGLPGEVVAVRDGRLLIDGEPLDEPYVTVSPTYEYGPVTLPPGEYLVLGDNRDLSADGHVWGTLPADHLIGPVRFRYWPPSRARGL